MSEIRTAENVTLIPATITQHSHMNVLSQTRVAAYCRVSTDEEEQQSSYKVQISYYTDYINSNPEWKLVGIFADEGISGTQTAKRTEFNKMIKMCRRKKIDLILCKSISRFARNTVDCLDYVRELKALGIAVMFEKENINTMSATSEFAISLYASFAQAESESISRNVTWGIERGFREGKVRYFMNQTLGYRMGDDGKPHIVEEEAQHVRDIFTMFAEGYSMKEIAAEMEARGVVRRNGRSDWNRLNVNAILRNEKYVGDAVLQKWYTVDCLTHKLAVNYGQKPKYLVQNCHEGIIDRETWDKVRLELAKRSANSNRGRKRADKGRYRTEYALTELLYCAHCGKPFRRTIWKFGDTKKGVWRCADRLESAKITCKKSPSLHEDKLHRSILAVINSMIDNTDKLNEAVQSSMEHTRSEIIMIDEEIDQIYKRLSEINSTRDTLLSCISGTQYERINGELRTLLEEEKQVKDKLEKLKQRKDKIQYSAKQAATARELFANMQPMSSFDDMTVRKLIERITVISKTEITVRFRGGLEVSGEVEK